MEQPVITNTFSGILLVAESWRVALTMASQSREKMRGSCSAV